MSGAVSGGVPARRLSCRSEEIVYLLPPCQVRPVGTAPFHSYRPSFLF